MPQPDSDSAQRGQSRRKFIKKTSAATAAVVGAGMLQLPVSARAQSRVVAIVLDAADPLTNALPVQWAAAQLRDALSARGVPARLDQNLDAVSPAQPCILVGWTRPPSVIARQVLEGAGIALPATPESLALARGRAQGKLVVAAAGYDERGLVYALLELADRVQYAHDPLAELKAVKPVSERPANEIRGVTFRVHSSVTSRTRPGFTTGSSGRRT